MLLSFRSDIESAAWLAFVMLSALAARQILMPAINRATDLMLKKTLSFFTWFVCFIDLRAYFFSCNGFDSHGAMNNDARIKKRKWSGLLNANVKKKDNFDS